MNPAMQACLRAREAWQAAGCPGATAQLAIFGLDRYRRPEVERAALADRPRRRRRRRR